MFEIEFENGETIICTDTHKWYVYDINKNIIKKTIKDIIIDGDLSIITTKE